MYIRAFQHRKEIQDIKMSKWPKNRRNQEFLKEFGEIDIKGEERWRDFLQGIQTKIQGNKKEISRVF